MKWYKHDTNANMDSKLQEVLLDYGLEGYGLYWYCLELIAANVTPEKLTFELEHDSRIIARNTGSSVEKVQQMMTRFVELKLFENDEGRITCLKIAKRADDYTAKLLKTQTADLKQLSGSVRETPINSDKNEKKLPKVKESKLNKNKKEKESSEKFSPILPNAVGIKKFIDHCESFNKKPIPENDAIFEYAEKSKITDEALEVCWLEFVERYKDGNKRYQDWRSVFRKCVRGNWFKLWWFDDCGNCNLTSAGRQAKNTHSERLAA